VDNANTQRRSQNSQSELGWNVEWGDISPQNLKLALNKIAFQWKVDHPRAFSYVCVTLNLTTNYRYGIPKECQKRISRYRHSKIVARTGETDRCDRTYYRTAFASGQCVHSVATKDNPFSSC